jgi:hypothetical protein
MRLGKRVGRFQVSEASADEVLDVMTGLKVQNEQEALL